MYTILMDNQKNLITTVRNTIHYKENGVDKIHFLLPPKYEEMDISECIVTLKYVDPYGNFHAEILTPDEELYKNYIRYTLPVTTNFTQVVGNICLRLTIDKFIPGEESTVINVLETNSTVVVISKPDGFNDFVSFEDIEAWKKQLSDMNKDITDLQGAMPTDLAIDDETDNLHLVHDGERIGDGVEIMVPGDNDLSDGDHDGIVDLNVVTDDDGDVVPAFIELEDDES